MMGLRKKFLGSDEVAMFSQLASLVLQRIEKLAAADQCF